MTRVLVAGLGDTGLLTATHLARHVEVVGVSAKPLLLSGQELGRRLAFPDEWARDYRIGFDAYRRLRGVRTVHASLTGLDPVARRVALRHPDGSDGEEPYDVLVISTGVRNGFWRTPELESAAEVDAGLRAAHARLAAAGSVLVVGGGAAAVSTAANIARRFPHTEVTLAFPGERALVQHHHRVWDVVAARLERYGVRLAPGHRAVLPEESALGALGSGPVAWSTGQQPTAADAVVWTVGRVRPNTAWLPPALLDDGGFVRVRPDLRVEGLDEVFAVGDVAATDPLRSSARNRADRLVASNVRALLAGRPLRDYVPPRRRWGSVLGAQPDGLQVFAPDGRPFRFPAWTLDPVLTALIVRRGIYGGVRPPRPTHPRLDAGHH